MVLQDTEQLPIISEQLTVENLDETITDNYLLPQKQM